jgi:hypothetical protein
MSAVVWANILLAVPFLLAFIAVPLWLTFRHPQTGADHSQAHAYLRSKRAAAREAAVPAGRTATPAHPRTRPAARAVAARRATAAARGHTQDTRRRAGAAA